MPASSPALDALPPDVGAVVAGYLDAVGGTRLLRGLYLHGSVALGAYDPAWSDVDFVAVLRAPATTADLVVLRRAHAALRSRHPALEGSYLQWDDLGRAGSAIAPAPCYHDGRLYATGRYDVNPVTWWVLERRGVCLLGDPTTALPFTVGRQELLAYTRHNLDAYWRRYTRRPRPVLSLLTDWGVQWAVLGVSRLVVTLGTGDVPDKVQAGRHMLARAPRHAPIIAEALRIRARASRGHYRSRLVRLRDALGYLRYCLGAGPEGE